MMVLIIENAPNRLRGGLLLWMFELKAGVYVMDCNPRLREWVWTMVCENIGSGSAMMVWSTHRSQFGFDVRSIGDTSRRVVSIDSIKFLGTVNDF